MGGEVFDAFATFVPDEAWTTSSCGPELFACCGVHAFPSLCRRCSCSENKREDDDCRKHALGAVHGDPDPGALIPLRRVGEDEHVE